MWNRDAVDFLDSRLLPWTAIPPGEVGGAEGGRRRILSSAPSGAMTAIAMVTSTISGVTRNALDVLVLGGMARSATYRLLPGTFAHYPAGARIHWEPLTTPLALYLGSFGAPILERDQEGPEEARVLHLDDRPWQDMEWRGIEPPAPDVKIKWLRRDESEGLGIAFVVGMLPGYQTTLEEAHPVYEESFKLHGDLLLGRRGVVGPGGYFFRPPGSWHGPLYSRYGNVSLIRKDGIGSTEYRDCVPGFTIEELKSKEHARHVPSYLRDGRL